MNELAAAINDDANYNSTLTTALATKLPLAGGTMTGALTTTGLTVNSGGVSSNLSIRNGSNNSFLNIYSDLNGVALLDVDGANVGGSPRFQIDVGNVQTFRIQEGGDISFYDTSGNAKLFWDASAKSLGIGTSSPSSKLTVLNGTANTQVASFSGADSGGGLKILTASTTRSDDTVILKASDAFGEIAFTSDNTEVMRITKDNNVGIGTSSPSAKLDIQQATAGNIISAEFDNTDYTANNRNAIKIRQQVSSSGSYSAYLGSDKNTGNLFLANDSITANHLVINPSGNVGIGTSSINAKLHVSDGGGAGLEVIPQTANNRTTLLSYDRSANTYQTLDTDSSDVHFNISGTEAMRIDSSGHVKINNGNLQIERSGSSPLLQFTDTGVNSRWMGLVDGTSNFTIYGTNGSTQELTLDSSGNLLVGTTTTGLHTTSTETGSRVGDGLTMIARGGLSANVGAVGYFNRLSTDGNILDFRKNGSSVGSIGTQNSGLLVGSTDSALYFHTDNNIYPYNPSNSAYRNGDVDLGWSSGRFRNLYLSGSIANPSGNLTLDVSGDINLDADGAVVNFQDGGTTFGLVTQSSNDFVVRNPTLDKDILFKGNDGGSTITALTLDMSDGGAAKFGAGAYNNSKGVTVFGSQGQLWVTSENATGGYFNRKSSDGVAITLARDDSDKGFIGVRNSNVYFSQASKGIGISSARIYPTDGDGNASNGAMDIGNSDAKFKDGYFSGNLYGNGSNLTGVGGSTTWGAVGTYTAASAGTGLVSAGSTVAGSTLKTNVYSNTHKRPLTHEWNASENNSLGASGTWRNMTGDAVGTQFSKQVNCLWVRIS